MPTRIKRNDMNKPVSNNRTLILGPSFSAKTYNEKTKKQYS